MSKEPVMRIYSCGGCGINLSQRVIDFTNDKDAIKTETVLIDTSTSNFDPEYGFDFYKIPGIEGTGKNRADSLSITEDKIEVILREYKPGTVNVVLCSGGGGTGSVIGFQIAKELISRGIPCITLLVASTDTGKETDNSLKSVLGLQRIVKLTNRPVPFVYFENTPNPSDRTGSGTRAQVDEAINMYIRCLAELVSEKHEELDRNDFKNFLFYDNVTNVTPQLVELLLGFKVEDFEGLSGKVITSCHTLQSVNDDKPDLGDQYGAVGYYRDEPGTEMPANKYWFTTAMNTVTFAEALRSQHTAFKSAAASLNEVKQIELDDDEELF